MRTRHYFWFSALAVLVLGTGISIHLTRLIMGGAWLVENFVTPTFDMGLAVAITVCSACFWLLRGQVEFNNRYDRIRYYAVALYFTISVPIHLATFVTRNTQAIADAFPAWYSALIIVVQLALAVSVVRTTWRTEGPGLRSLIVRLDGLFLVLAGSAALLTETVAHFFSLGPQRAVFGNQSWATIGFFEAHGLAIIIGVILVRLANSPGVSGNTLGAIVHLLLGGANILFWTATVIPTHQEAIIAPITAVHLLFVVIQASYAVNWSARGRSERLVEAVGAGQPAMSTLPRTRTEPVEKAS
jgi:hypothetical protein